MFADVFELGGCTGQGVNDDGAVSCIPKVINLIIGALKELASRFVHGKTAVSNLDYGSQSSYINRFDEPKDDFERSYYQYCCQMKLLGAPLAALYNIAAIPLLLFYRIRLSSGGAPECSRVRTSSVFLHDGSKDILPPTLVLERDIVHVRDFQSTMSLSSNDVLFLNEMRRRNKFSFFYRLKCMLKIAIYSEQIRQHNPVQIIVSGEYSFTSSVLTRYCEVKGIEHINVMHGEKLYNVTDSFFRFHKCYVWDSYYADLFTSLKADSMQFVVEKPPSQLPWEMPAAAQKHDFTYYLGAEKGEKLRRIGEVLTRLASKGYAVVVRPHPLYSDLGEVYSVFDGAVPVEDASKIPIKESLAGTRRAASLFSTVLMQAENNGIEVVVDDVTSIEDYNKLQELRFRRVTGSHNRLSDYLI